MSMQTTTNVDHAVEFLRWFFGDDPDGYIYILRQRPSANPVEARQGKFDLAPSTFSKPGKIDTSWWHEQGHLWSQVFSTATTKTREHGNQKTNCVSVPCVWVDIDGCKKLGIPGDEFYKELRDTEELSAWTRSSANGIQGFFKLKRPVEVHGNSDVFAEELAGILWDIMYYFGGDPKVVRLGNNMRLPGSLNVKPEYDTHYMAQAKTYDNVYSLKALNKRFPTDPNTVPRLIAYAVNRALGDCYEPGSRHEVILQLCGSVRKGGMNKEACSNLVKQVCKWFGDSEDRSADVQTTYDAELETIATLHRDYKDCATKIDNAVELWLDLKKIYCKKRGFEFVPETYDPTKPPPPDGKFWVRDNQTYYLGKSGEDELFGNFEIELKGKVIKADNLMPSWLALIRKPGDQPVLVEIPAEKTVSWKSFVTCVPVGMSLLASPMWAEYIAYLDKSCPDITMVESTNYGILDVDKGQPTMLLPNVSHPKYVWVQRANTATPDAFGPALGHDEAAEYLERLVDYMSRFHEPRLVFPSLAWFAACSISGIIWQQIQGFPVLMICGLVGSGKTHLFEFCLAPHYGVEEVYSYDRTTPFALSALLSSNNICPLVMDEFRIGQSKLREDTKAKATESIIRNLFDRHQTAQGTASGALTGGTLCAPLCIIGEHHYVDQATVERTFTIRLTRQWVSGLQERSADEQRQLEIEREWLFSYEHRGKLGRILIPWVEKHLEDIPDIVREAHGIVRATAPVRVDRKLKGFTAVASGELLLRAIFADHGLKYPIKKSAFREAMYTSDTRLQDSLNYDTETLRNLFEATDHLIINAIRQHAPLHGHMFVYDIDNPQRAYFDMGRWFKYLNEHHSVSQSASLTDKTAFRDLLNDHSKGDVAPVVGFPEKHPLFAKSCVEIDLTVVQERFGINTEQWGGLEQYHD